ncbi:unnamed protein product [Protopolystoma xenopodis]|uniref:Uncharacterized protein n=1 Tax=Protopolystoma xenopodis TaxID=117903 RepID=A0A3S5B6P0_9PLAT|nr:unnamed protein product [Protopolystoma xenopodis]
MAPVGRHGLCTPACSGLWGGEAVWCGLQWFFAHRLIIPGRVDRAGAFETGNGCAISPAGRQVTGLKGRLGRLGVGTQKLLYRRTDEISARNRRLRRGVGQLESRAHEARQATLEII